ncbi:DUF2000 domain-containing protein [Superficieibacter electus]|uniref:DUF2000 domain-containing protein n=1 Tax=Superficieibacter electus TaxID=2022662 RepID=A0A2P5GVR7_9ENTR|nr:DUF2000 domain-containing protein [Superficieibacter electus]POP47637.1 DUF2000 domain-containing protein [Superficieibacter electus]POP50648.1 DUF2000 domain-containing protein [Superficieibacter electus]
MKFDASQHRCTIIIDNALPAGLAINAASVIGISFGRTIAGLVGPDRQSLDAVNYPGVISAPLPVLRASGEALRHFLSVAEADNEMYVMPFSALAQSCKTYDEYGERISAVNSDAIALVAIGLAGPKKKVTKMTGDLPLYK